MERSARSVKRRAPTTSTAAVNRNTRAAATGQRDKSLDGQADLATSLGQSPNIPPTGSATRTTRAASKLATGESHRNSTQFPPVPGALPQSEQPRSKKRVARSTLDPLEDLGDPSSLGQAASREKKRRRRGGSTDLAPLSTRASKRQRNVASTAMSNSGAPTSSSTTSPNDVQGPSTSTRRIPFRPKKDGSVSPNQTGTQSKVRGQQDEDLGPQAPKGRSKRKPRTEATSRLEETPPDPNDEQMDESEDEEGEDDLDDAGDHEDDVDMDDPFSSALMSARAGPAAGFSNTLRALSGMLSGVSTRFRDILNNLKQSNDPSVQLIALQELSELLLVSTEDNLSGHFSPEAFVKELVTLLQPSDFGEENPEMMLLACRCIANLMEALPSSTSSVVCGGAVPILCQKLLEIHYIDLAEQALSTLEKISVEFPVSIVREGGLTACLTYLDFFATSTQRTAVTTAANCCRNIPEESFPVVRDVMPVLLNVLGSSDQKVVEQGCLCVSRIVESFKFEPEKLENLISTELLLTIIRLLLPGSTNLIGPHIHTQFLRVLAITAKASAKLSAELLKMKIVDTLYQILTGVSPPAGTEDIAAKIDNVVIMQALIHRPREQVFETLNVIGELLPGIPPQYDSFTNDQLESFSFGSFPGLSSKPLRFPSYEARMQILRPCQEQLRRFAIVLFPTLTDAYSSTVNLSVRQKVINAQLKMLSNLDPKILEDALHMVPYASFIASILSQQDHPSLVLGALQAAELLLRRLEDIYRYQFYREGVTSEITKLAESHSEIDKSTIEEKGAAPALQSKHETNEKSKKSDGRSSPTQNTEKSADECSDEEMHDDATSSSSSSSDEAPSTQVSAPPDMSKIIAIKAQQFLAVHETESQGVVMRHKASKILKDLQTLAESLRDSYINHGKGNGRELFQDLSIYFQGDALESITSCELLKSGIADILLELFSRTSAETKSQARADFLDVFMGQEVRNQSKTTNRQSPSTPFSALIAKLQDLLSRAEHFEVVTVHQSHFDGTRSSTSAMLMKQLRLKLVADEDSGIPSQYRNIMVSIHAIATFKALDDYLRPRIGHSERPRVSRHRDGLSNALAAFTAAAGLPSSPQQGIPESGTQPPMATSTSTGPSPAPHTVETPRRFSKKKPASAGQAPPRRQSERSSVRRSQRNTDQAALPPPPPSDIHESERHEDPLECADERQMDDDDELDDDGSALDTIVDDLDEGIADSAADPTAVNVEVASTGKVTAHKEDGSRVSTPSQAPGLALRPAVAPPPPTEPPTGSTPSALSRSMSYAAAIQAVPQDWHLEFSIRGQPLLGSCTIYRAVHQSRDAATEILGRNIFTGLHTINIKRVAGPPPPESNSMQDSNSATGSADKEGTEEPALPESLGENETTATIFRLLNILHALNANLDDVFAGERESLKLNTEPMTQFVNTKLTAKMNRQLEEPLIVASNALPTWSHDLARLYPFLFPFETRHLFLQSTSFGYSRSLMRWQNSQNTSDGRQGRHRDQGAFVARLQRQKVRISRSRILESAIKVMELYGSSQSILEVEYFEEVGTGLGPTLEFYSSVSKEFCKKKLRLWRENDSNKGDEYVFGKNGLFPAPMSDQEAESEQGKKTLHLFGTLGKFVARSMLDSRIIDLSFNPTLFRLGNGANSVQPSLGAINAVDHDLAKSLKLLMQFALAKQEIDQDISLTADDQAEKAAKVEFHGAKVDDMGLDFTLPGYPSIELEPNGSQTSVTIDNVGSYLVQVLDMTLGKGIRRQLDAFRKGFSFVFPYDALRTFTPDELVMLFGRVEEDWSLETLMDSIKADHGYNMDSRSVKNLLQTMSELSPPERREFLQFVTGSPKLPIGGFKSLTPMFTVVCKPSEPPYVSDNYLPSVMTCVNYLKLPDYSEAGVMRKRLETAMKEGQGAFHLS